MPGVTEYTFHKLLCYLYTDEIPAISAAKCLNLLELANRLVLRRLLNCNFFLLLIFRNFFSIHNFNFLVVECRVIEDLSRMAQNETSETVEQCLKLLEPVKV